ncbi:MAG: serine/threonine-protein kinase [Gloeotrichia echinulata IR180]
MIFNRGQTLQNGKYTIQKVLGEGGFGITYLAVDNTTRQKVVIKTLNDQVQARRDFDQFQERFRDEAERLRQCQHPNIVKFYKLIKEGHLSCIVMEYVEGQDLATLVRQQQVLKEADVLNYIQQIGDALREVHRQNILHRDIKPENIILRKNTPQVILIDFGIARDFIPHQHNQHTEFLSHGFAPVEQYFRSMKPGFYTDVYALAATLYVLLTGYEKKGGVVYHRLPASIERDHEVKDSKPDPLVAPKKINPNISIWVNDAILKGMAIAYDKRPQSVRQWLALLETNNIPQPPTIPDLPSWLIPSAISLFVVVIYFLAPNIQPPIPPPVQIDYKPIEQLLKSQNFKEADDETLRVMLSLARRKQDGFFNKDNIQNFPCNDLNKINQLWVKSSNGKFGFSIQKKIWSDVGGQPGLYNNPNLADKFTQRVGWGVDLNKWQRNISYKLSAPAGQLPFKVTSRVYPFGVPYWAERLQSCNIH